MNKTITLIGNRLGGKEYESSEALFDSMWMRYDKKENRLGVCQTDYGTTILIERRESDGVKYLVLLKMALPDREVYGTINHIWDKSWATDKFLSGIRMMLNSENKR